MQASHPPARLAKWAIGLAALTLISAAEPASASGPVTIKDVGFASPVAIRYRPHGDDYLVSNINGPALSYDNNGFISRLSPDGKVLDLKWIAGGQKGVALNAPKGLALSGGKLYVADIDVVRVFDAASGKPLGTIKAPGAIALSDIAAAPDGTLFVSDVGRDLASGAIFRIDAAGKVGVLVRGERYLRPNAIAIRPDGRILYAPLLGELVVTLSATGEVEDFRYYPPVALPNWPAHPLGRLAGVVMLDDRTALVASREAQKVAKVRIDGPSAMHQYFPYDAKTKRQLGYPKDAILHDGDRWTAAPPSAFVLSDLADPARMDVDRKRNQLLVTEVTANAVVIAPLPDAPLAQAGD